MSFFKSINISATGLTAERLRMDIISKNIANVNTTRTSSGMPYRRQVPIFQEKQGKSFSDFLNEVKNGYKAGTGVEVSAIKDDKSPFKRVYNPGHPEADEKGYVLMPNVDIVTEMINLISASRAYEANVTAINTTKGMAMKALEIGR
ncbi:flagellar basal body rod protein FlgC [Paramaledivibacter caminithermalis]|jgi:flagellar basal-body rod protein FlgC|uniref:Flagellar basal-body rod protein FlgC n=1 Tax=Paramaledivibacter caminithermalis (strain DSM 15212 / CIP 107654 / DViRD3) TaxID=1121301 RepID=A0A1M6N844_PARC5|nr:flagellar basal body rod protein FlgC [Paramaledivibacter caminithermalis]SHJ91889.1 flagellar basal-body rod protein FlgC [Paramaledivibacter caminithermalis DSM 15212]